MKKISSFFIALILIGALSGCVTREQADQKLVKGCQAGVNALLTDGMKIDRVKDTSLSPSPEGQGLRHVKMTTITMDGWLETEKTYECIFEESFGLFNMNYTASIYQLRTGEATYGKAGEEIMGSAEDFIKLTDAIRKAMYE